MPMSEVLEWLHTNQPQVEVEVEKDWLWVTTELAPLHKKCECVECANRKNIRESIKTIGFRFAFNGHPLASGKVSRWAHSCDHPVRFKKKSGGSSESADKPSESISDEQLAAMLA